MGDEVKQTVIACADYTQKTTRYGFYTHFAQELEWTDVKQGSGCGDPASDPKTATENLQALLKIRNATDIGSTRFRYEICSPIVYQEPVTSPPLRDKTSEFVSVKQCGEGKAEWEAQQNWLEGAEAYVRQHPDKEYVDPQFQTVSNTQQAEETARLKKPVKPTKP